MKVLHCGTAEEKTPSEASDFEREQLRFFLSSGDIAVGLAEINPSLAWLPELMRMNVARDPSQLARWIGRNFSDPEAVREVAANLEYFDETTADLLEFRLNRQIPTLSPLLAKSWNLIIRHIQNSRRGMLHSDWYKLQPRLKAGDRSPEVAGEACRFTSPKAEAWEAVLLVR